MSITFRAQCYLAAWDAGLPIDGGLAFESQLGTCQLDYSWDSLARIDQLLDEIRDRHHPRPESFLDHQPNVNFLYLLAFYVGEVRARLVGLPAKWITWQDLIAQDASMRMFGEGFHSSVVQVQPGVFLPLVSISVRLFEGPDEKSVRFSAGFLEGFEVKAMVPNDQPLPSLPPQSLIPDFENCFKQLRASARTPYLEPSWPKWFVADGLDRLRLDMPKLLQSGRVVWGSLVQANNGLFDGSVGGAPLEVLYDPQGVMPFEDIRDIALKLYAMKGTRVSHPGLQRYADHLEKETTRLFDWKLPQEFLPYPMVASTTFVFADWLPHQRIASHRLPLLIHDELPGSVVLVPWQIWPDAWLTDYSADEQKSIAHQRVASLQQEIPEPLQEDEALKTRLRADAEKLRRAFREQLNVDVNYDLEGVRWLEKYIQNQYLKKVPLKSAHVEVMGAFLGECIIQNIGGQWATYEDTVWVRLGARNGVFPLTKVTKLWENGLEAGDSVVSFYQVTAALQMRTLSDAQKRLLDFFNTSGQHQIFVPCKAGDVLEWVNVVGCDEQWVRLGANSLTQVGTVSYPLHQVANYYVLTPAGELIHTEGLDDPNVRAQLPANIMQLLQKDALTAQVKNQPYQVAPLPASAEMVQILDALRQRFKSVQEAATPTTLQAMRAPNPLWMGASDPLTEIGKQQLRLLSEGQIVWAALVQANSLLFSPGPSDCPALLVYSRDHYFDARPHELLAIAKLIFKLKSTTPDDPELQAVAKLVTDEMDRSMGAQVPEALTPKDVRTAAFMVFRRHLPTRVLDVSHFPILIHPDTQAVMIAPCEAWPPELLKMWPKPVKSLGEIRRLPVGIHVTHTPNPALPVKGGEGGKDFIWMYQTVVKAMHANLTIKEFGTFHEIDGQWQSPSAQDYPFSNEHFSQWYSCPSGILKVGVPAIDPENWNKSNQCRKGRVLWYFIGEDAQGKLFRGESTLIQETNVGAQSHKMATRHDASRSSTEINIKNLIKKILSKF